MKIILTSVYNSDRWKWLEWNRNVRNFNLYNIEEYIHMKIFAHNNRAVALIYLSILTYNLFVISRVHIVTVFLVFIFF